MKKVGFVISRKENENRRAITFEDVKKIRNTNCLYFENGYGEILGISDTEIKNMGYHVISRDNIFKTCDIVVDPKIGDAEYLDKLNNKTIFGWVHATQNYDITQALIDHKLTAYAWEKMFEGNRHVFYKNNEIAGEASILHAMLTYGKNFAGLDAAVIGNGNSAKGAIRILNQIGANVTIYTRNKEDLFRKEFSKYDIIVNCILWDVERKDHLLYKKDLKKMKKNALIIDVSCDHNGGIESSIPTTIANPIYVVDGITHYVVDHTPSMLHYDATKSISREAVKYIDLLIEGKENTVLKNCKITEKGNILDKEIIVYQNRE